MEYVIQISELEIKEAIVASPKMIKHSQSQYTQWVIPTVLEGIGDADLARLLSTLISGSVLVGRTGFACTTGGRGFTTEVYSGTSFSGSW